MGFLRRYLICGFFAALCVGCGVSVDSNSVSSVHSDFEKVAFEEVVFRPGVNFSLIVESGGEVEIDVDSIRVQHSGKAILPLIGSFSLDGLSLESASGKLTEQYGKFYVQAPLVRIQFKEDEYGGESPWGYVTVLGRVEKPGRVGLPPSRDLTVSAAIQGADGFASSANLSAVKVSRNGSDGQVKQLVIDLNKIGEIGSEQDVQLRAGDVVYVPERIF